MANTISSPETAIAERIAGYLRVLSQERNADAAADYYTEDARVLGPGMDLDRSAVVAGLRTIFEAGTEVQVDRRTLEIFTHTDIAYEIAQAKDVIVGSNGSSTTMRNNMFIRWELGEDQRWRFARVLLSPQELEYFQPGRDTSTR